MRSTYPVLFLLWSLLSSTFVAAQKKGLRDDKDTYTVGRNGDTYDVYTPYYAEGNVPVTTLVFPSDERGQIIVTAAWNNREGRHADSKPRLFLSDVIRAVASSRHANRPLETVDWVVARTVLDKQVLAIVKDYYRDWKKLHRFAGFPDKLTVKQTDSYWPAFKHTSFYKTVTWTWISGYASPARGFGGGEGARLRLDYFFHNEDP
ncbi:hypothetical protein LX36DRAFT_650798 [Colletotrichum falcatum]|nr:hypothetical protein LX36DRAFT_650798 [Colletotrichum falcatum]